MTEADLHALVRMLQADSPLHQLSNMEARTVFELMLQRGYTINHHQPKPSSEGRQGGEAGVSPDVRRLVALRNQPKEHQMKSDDKNRNLEKHILAEKPAPQPSPGRSIEAQIERESAKRRNGTNGK